MYWYRFTSYPGAMPPMPAGSPWIGAAAAAAGAPSSAGTAAEALANNVANAAAAHHLPPQVPLPSFHPHHHQTVHPSSHPHQPYTVDMYRSCRRAGSRMLPLLVVGGLGFWAFSKISKLREENYDLRDRIRSDEKASLATTATTPVAMSIDEGKDAKDANKNTASSSGEWRRDWRGRRYGRPRGEEEAHRI